jgi:ankyrin repeat protein
LSIKATPLEWAVWHGQADVLPPLLATCANLPAGQAAVRRAFDDAISRSLAEAAAVLWPSLGVDDQSDERWQQLLLAIVRQADAKALHALAVAAGPGAFRSCGPETVVIAAALEDPACVRLLLEGGADPNGVSPQFTPLLAAAATNRVPAIEALIAAGAKLDLTGADGVTPLNAAVRNRHYEAIATLVEKGASLAHRDPDGATPLHYAIGRSDRILATTLMDHGAPISAVDKNDMTPLAYALTKRSEAMIQLLTDRGARLDLAHNRFEWSLERALQLDQVVLLQRAADDGWNPNTPLHGSWPARRVAEFFGATATAAWLRDNGGPSSGPTLSRLGEVDVAPRVKNVRLGMDARFFYPAHLATGVDVTGVIDRDGRFRFVRVVRTPHSHLEKLVLDRVAQWEFEPARKGTEAVPVHVMISVTFKPDDRRREPPVADRVTIRDADAG